MHEGEREALRSLARHASQLNINAGGVGEIRLCTSCPDKDGWYVAGFSTEGFRHEDDTHTCEVRLDPTNPQQMQLRDWEGEDVWTVRASASNLCRFLTGCGED